MNVRECKLKIIINYENKLSISDFKQIIDLVDKSFTKALVDNFGYTKENAKQSIEIDSVKNGSIDIQLIVNIAASSIALIKIVVDIIKYFVNKRKRKEIMDILSKIEVNGSKNNIFINCKNVQIKKCKKE